ncbi:MAG: 3'-5' exonuclease, partial [Bacteroidetes bacterium]|nr:3'-5' exonuclease [Bacteroidota bacterium]
MLENLDLTNVLAIDIETVPMVKNYSDLDDHWKKLWTIKASQKHPNMTPEEAWPSAGIYAEFGKIVCISAGAFIKWGKTYQFKIKSYASDNETEV